MRATERRWIRACTTAHGRPRAMTMTAAQPATKMAWKAWSPGSSTATRVSATEWAIVAPANAMPPARTGHSVRRAGPLAAASRQTQTAASAPAPRHGEPEVGVLDDAREVRQRADEEDVVRAVVPTRGVEEGIAEQRAAERGDSSFQVDGGDERARTPRAQHAGREGDDEVDQQGEREAGGERAEAQDERRSPLPAGPERGEPANSPASRARSPIRPPRRAIEVTSPAATSARPAMTGSAAASSDCPA